MIPESVWHANEGARQYAEFTAQAEVGEGIKNILLEVGHTYQPPREFALLSRTATGERANIVSWVNEQIYQECYKPIFLEREKLPPGMLVSFYGPLREWLKEHKPEEFQTMVEKIISLGEEAPYRIMGDPYIHLILPLESEETQDMLVKTGKKAFEDDMGFTPKGFWLPEAAVSHTTLAVLARNGYEYVVLRDNQVKNSQGNPMYVEVDDHGELRRIAVIHVDSEISGDVSFKDQATFNADYFLDDLGRKRKGLVGFATDTEFYGHHRKGKDLFLDHVTRPTVQNKHGFSSFDIQQSLKDLAESPVFGDIRENSSWSCEEGHNLGRWKGDPICGCDGDHSPENYKYKRELYSTLKNYGNATDKALDVRDENWRENFVDFFLTTRKSMFANGNIEDVVTSLIAQGFNSLSDPTTKNLYFAQLARLTGMTSCFNFFGGKDRIEREIARLNLREIEALLPGIEAFKPTQDQISKYVYARLNGESIDEAIAA